MLTINLNELPQVKGCIVSPNGYKFIQVDYKQLEIYTLALWTYDAVLTKEIMEDKDVHHENACYIFDTGEPTKEQRRIAKACTFRITYGGGETEEIERDYINKFYEKYFMVRLKHQWMQQEANDKGDYEGHYRSGQPVRSWMYTTDYGKRYCFIESINKRNEPYFKPTYLKNYPVQGLASDILRMAMAESWRLGCYSIAQMHDSLLFMAPYDVSVNYDSFLIDYPRRKLTSLGLNWPNGLNLRVEYEEGTNLQELTGVSTAK